jgi:hypothetical protein
MLGKHAQLNYVMQHSLSCAGSVASRGTEFGEGSSNEYIVDIECLGSEGTLIDCEHTIKADCSHHDIAVAKCLYNGEES